MLSLKGIDTIILKTILEKGRFLAAAVLDSDSQINEDESAAFEEKTTMSFPYLTDSSGQPFQPVFTDWTELGVWGSSHGNECNTTVIGFDDVRIMLENTDILQGVVVNPFSNNLIIMKENIKKLR